MIQTMSRLAVLALMLASLAACGLPTGPAGQLSPASRYNPISGEVNSNGR